MEFTSTRDPEIFRIGKVNHFDHRLAVSISLLFVGSFFAAPALADPLSGWFPKVAALLLLGVGGWLGFWRKGVIINLRDREIIRGWGPIFLIFRRRYSINSFTRVVVGPKTRKLPNPLFPTYPICLDREDLAEKTLIIQIPDILEASSMGEKLAGITGLTLHDLTESADLPTRIFT